MKNLIDISKKILENIENLDDLIDSYFEPVKDLTETAGDIFSPIKAIHSLYTFNKKRKFKKFLKSYALNLDPESFDLKNTERLKAYLKDEKNYNFLNTVIENAINSKSVFGSIILGHYAAEILSNEKIITFKELLIVEGLRELNDYELSSFIKIYSVADLSKMVYFKQLNLKGSKFFSKLTIEKLIQLRWIEKDHTTYMGSSANHNFTSGECAEEVFFLIKDTEVYSELLKFE
ncbi:hypothetical protein [Flavobacterium sp.]|uniref:hypothetical protein n=1 Tax=Flavobacterium sp. TaxID=239 RepID=UPI00260AFAF2|nr:hypothetical protein [Flavobacterium sp.]